MKILGRHSSVVEQLLIFARGTGRYNLALGAIAPAQGIGAALSNLVAGYIVNAWGFDAGFLGAGPLGSGLGFPGLLFIGARDQRIAAES